jgi:hypothetical protein
MRTWFLITAVVAATAANASGASPRPDGADPRHELRDGFYVPIKSNNKSVCPLELKTYRTDGKLTALAAMYVGDCYRQGPFEYYCQEERELTSRRRPALICWSSFEITFTIRDAEHFFWHNKPYEIWAEFVRK